MEFTPKKFRLIGARARIKKIIQILDKLTPEFESLYDLWSIPLYLGYLIKFNDDAQNFRFTEDEIQQLEQIRKQLMQWDTDNVAILKRPFNLKERQKYFKLLRELRYRLADKIQASLKETSFIILERDATYVEPIVWPKEVVVALDHLRSPFNVGAIVRTMECVGLNRIMSIGYTPRLDSPQVQRSAMGCEAGMEVEYVHDGVAALTSLQQQGFQIYVLETVMPSHSVFQLNTVLPEKEDLALVVGNEEFGVDESIIAIANHLLHIPTFGKKNSLNVSIAFSIAIYQVWAALMK